MLHYHLMELHAAGFTDVCLIVQPGGEDAILRYLRGPDAQTVARLAGNERLAEEMRRMRAFAQALTFVHQHEQLGYGHGVVARIGQRGVASAIVIDAHDERPAFVVIGSALMLPTWRGSGAQMARFSGRGHQPYSLSVMRSKGKIF